MSGLAQNWTASDSTIVENKDSVITITKYDAYLLRRYITDLEYRSASYDLAQDKLTLLENKNLVWEQTANNYKEQRDLANLALTEQVALQNEVNAQIVEDLELSNKAGKRKGRKQGAIVAAAATLVICLLVK